MSYQTIEEYFTQFPDDVEEINVKFNSKHLPDLLRFYKLKTLNCYNNQLTSLPPLPSTLKILRCHQNQLTYLPPLPSTLKMLWCYKNKLTYLPRLPYTLKILWCCNNQLTYLPHLQSTLEILWCSNNKLTYLPSLPYNLTFLKSYNNLFFDYYIKPENMSIASYIIQLRNQINIVNQFRELFYALKYKKQFQYLLWIKIREPKIRNKYHPNNLIAILDGKDEITLDELDNLIDNW
jgi:hypothetical protein